MIRSYLDSLLHNLGLMRQSTHNVIVDALLKQHEQWRRKIGETETVAKDLTERLAAFYENPQKDPELAALKDELRQTKEELKSFQRLHQRQFYFQEDARA